ncbi:MAG: ABC transporter ATP-binding protein [Desulfobulbaceae bacterium]|nr:ABC transporter ATP-binding protein [Desulfobulbaceae bacterium]
MSSEIAIKIENLSKCYQVYDTPHDRLKQFVFPKINRAIAPLQRLVDGHPLPVTNYYKEFWALKDVSFEVKKGETVGIIGCNGSGKSTLLQMICGTLNPTSGNIQTNGRIAALLELGSGFNPEFTGRENVYMNAAVLGLGTEEIDARFEDIAAFADIGNFIEQPVKTYSSGMMVRLAFAVAINVQPEILVVDEALSVGDELFQRKCFSRIEAIRANGATILFVSHSGAQVVELCDRAVLLDAGERLATGTPKQIVGRYQKMLYAPADKHASIRQQIKNLDKQQQEESSSQRTNTAKQLQLAEEVLIADSRLQESFDPYLIPNSTIQYESHGALINSPCLFTISGAMVNNLCRGRIYKYCYTVHFARNASNVRFGMLIKTLSGMELGGAASAATERMSLAYVESGTTYQVEFRFRCSLNVGTYFLNAGVVGEINGSATYLHRLIDIAMFRVLPETDNLATGIVDFDCYPEYNVLEALSLKQ